MKNKHLIQAIEFVKRLGCIVKRQHVDGLTVVSVTNKDGTQSAAKVYKTGSSNPQARYIKTVVKGFKMVERGVMFRTESGAVYFLSEHYRVLYRWHKGSSEWRLWIGDYRTSGKAIRNLFVGRWCNARVECNKLMSGVHYHDES